MNWKYRALLAASLVVVLAVTPQLFAQPAPTQLDQIEAVSRETKQTVDALKAQAWIRDWGPVIGTILTASVAIYSLGSQLAATKELAKQNLQMAERTLKEKAREEERKAIREKVDQFYGPFVLIRGTSNNLFKMFLARRSVGEVEQYKSPRGNFSTLIALINGWRPEGVDKQLLDQILAMGNQTAELIRSKIGLVDDQELQKLLWRALTHYLIIDLANRGSLDGIGVEVNDYTFPAEIDGKVQEKITKLQEMLAELKA